MLLGNGNVTVSVADLNIAKNLTITGGNGNETIDIGTDALAHHALPVAALPLPSRLAAI